MSIKYVILGYLSWQSLTGYEIKKIIAASEILPWTANNNQIYRALIQLHEESLVSKTVEDGDGTPDRYRYTATESGKSALREWAASTPGLTQGKKTFLHQLMWADSLEEEQIDQLLETYLDEVSNQLFMLRVQADRKPDSPGRTSREAFLWERIYQNWITQYEAEAVWIRETRRLLVENAAKWG
jgi:DNA-binding PadR family transcriptional regulator